MKTYRCGIGCKTCNYAPNAWFDKKEDVLAIIFHKQLIGENTDREVRIRLDDDNNELPGFFHKHQDHELVLIDHEGIRAPSEDDFSLMKVTYNRGKN